MHIPHLAFISIVTLCSLSASDAQQESLVEAQFAPDPFQNEDKLNLVLNNDLQLTDCIVRPNSFTSSGNSDSYNENVQCSYCHMADDIWAAQRQNPAGSPSFRDMVGESNHCSERMYPFSLKELAAKAREHDEKSGNVPSGGVKGIVYHQVGSGSSVLMNAITAAEGDSAQVYSDHAAVITLATACNRMEESECDPSLQAAAMSDLVYLLSRSKNNNQSIYFKMSPCSTASIPMMRQAVGNSDTKWLFVSRDDDEVVMKETSNRYSNCKKNRNGPSTGLAAYVKSFGYDSLRDLSDVEVCSAYNAYTHYTAESDMKAHKHSYVIDYETTIKDPKKIIELMGDLFDIDATSGPTYQKVLEQTRQKSSARGASMGAWSEPVETLSISDEVKNANGIFLK